MKLINQFTLWYLAIFAFVLLVGGVLIYYKFESQIEYAQSKELEKQLVHIAQKIKIGIPANKIVREQIQIRELKYSAPTVRLHLSDTIAWSRQLQRMERQIKAASSYKINGKHYYISVYNMMIRAQDVTKLVIQAMLWIFVLLLILLLIFIRIGSEKILSPFNQSLVAIHKFSLKQKKAISLPETGILEFKELNHFLQKMTKKALCDYNSLKEFSENASHELQTPLAIIQGKLELLMESDINDEQATLILTALNALDKLTKTNQSLILLTKLENEEYESIEQINFSQLVNETMKGFEELIDMKSIHLEKQICDNVLLKLHPVLASILLNNLLSNAIRHNNFDGCISVQLSTSKLLIENSGNPPTIPTEEFFHRFKKSNPDSIGLGLSIVKQICELHLFNIQYLFRNNKHAIEVTFNKRA
ncbi:Signal transduction histidine kinase [Pseudarcicella hirudinis]|uniref:histidine kinase n=2 Tax=Pseudarcicella hirudinis TaxID=1079859 RepID=A0A1I5TV65_9BACT|nr:HAMP domain-containing sensor histidine kinase [Pseudarcicella hirudinis]SFP86196.1 Signal transduction histidine kinase [Pseudarcicella hirudinis]